MRLIPSLPYIVAGIWLVFAVLVRASLLASTIVQARYYPQILVCSLSIEVKEVDMDRVVTGQDIDILYILGSVYLLLPAIIFIAISASLVVIIYSLNFEKRDSKTVRKRICDANPREADPGDANLNDASHGDTNTRDANPGCDGNVRPSVVRVNFKARAARAAALLTRTSIYVLLNIPYIVALCYGIAYKPFPTVGVTTVAEMVKLYDWGLTGKQGMDNYLVAGVYVVLPLVNSCVNPSVYFTQMKDFRKHAILKMKSCIRIFF